MINVTQTLCELAVMGLAVGSQPELPVLKSNEYHRDASITVALQRDHIPRLVAEENGQTVGALAYSFQSAHAVEPYLTHQLKGQVLYVHDLGSATPGAGRALMKAVEAVALSKGLPVILGYTNSSRPFYQKLGYCCLGGLAWKEANEL